MSKNNAWGGTPLIDESEIFGDLTEHRGTTLLLGRYTMAEVLGVLEKKGFFKQARKRGYGPLRFALDSSAYPLQRFQIFLGRAVPEMLMVDLKIRESAFDPRDRGLPESVPGPARTLNFEWLTLQNPRAEFTDKRGALPGQLHPSLGLSRPILEIFVFLGKRTHKDALLAFPAYCHNAILFSHWFRFIRPEKQGEILAVQRACRGLSIKQLAWIVHLNCLRASDGSIYEWRAEEQMLPLKREWSSYFDSRAYRERVKEADRSLSFSIDREAYERKVQAD